MEYPVTLMEREDTDHRVELVYNGPQARQLVTIHVYWHSGDFPDFAFGVEGEQALEAFLTRTASGTARWLPDEAGTSRRALRQNPGT